MSSTKKPARRTAKAPATPTAIGGYYRALTKFKSAGKVYHRGDRWEPTGGPKDEGVKRHLVEFVPED